MKPKLLILAILVVLLSLTPTLALGIFTTDDTSQATTTSDYAIVELKGPPLASYDGSIPGLAATKPTPGNKLDLNSPAAKAYSDYLASGRADAERWLHGNAPEVNVVIEYSVVLNGFAVKLNGHPMSHLWNVPGVGLVGPDLMYTIEQNRSPTLINAPVLWAAVGGQPNAGAGIKIGIIDTGIDNTHPFLTDPTLVVPAGFPKCDAADSSVGVPDTSCMFVSNKVLVAKVFQTEATSFTAQAAQSHGSHVSGTAAGVAGTPCRPAVEFLPGCTLSGIAPKAWLGNYNVFPGNVGSTPSRVIAKAVEEAVADGMDVLNLSLGGPASPPIDPLVNALNHAVDAGLVAAVAAGNSGPGAGTIESPGVAEKVITAGASTNPHFRGVPAIEVNPPGTTFGAATPSRTSAPQFVPATTADLDDWNVLDGPGDGRACTPLPAGSAAGKIVLIRRGVCTFSVKLANAVVAGATGVIVRNNVVGDPIAMGEVAGIPFTIPAVMVSISAGASLVTYAAGPAPQLVTVDGTSPHEFFTDGPSADILAGFSSRGPPLVQTPAGGNSNSGLLNKIKPDVTAPGVNVYSSVLPSNCSSPPCYSYFQGTSMATPHVAGSAAVLKQLHPTWSPEQIKSALVNTAKRPVFDSFSGTPLANPMQRGGGRIDLGGASVITATIETSESQASIAFGSVTSKSFTETVDVTLTSVVGGSVTYTVAVACGSCGPSVTVSAASVTLASGATATITVTLTVSSSVAQGDYFGDVVFSGGATTLYVPYWVRVGMVVGGAQARGI